MLTRNGIKWQLPQSFQVKLFIPSKAGADKRLLVGLSGGGEGDGEVEGGELVTLLVVSFLQGHLTLSRKIGASCCEGCIHQDTRASSATPLAQVGAS